MKKLVSILMAAALLLAMYSPVSAADWDLYGSARVNTWWTDYSEERGDDTQLNHDLQGNARIGAHVDAGAIGGRFEYGHGGGNTGLRLLYGTVDMGQGQLLVGQHYAPYGIGSFISTQAYNQDEGLLAFVAYTGRQPMVQYSLHNFKLALVKPNTSAYPDSTIIGYTALLRRPVFGPASTDYNPEVLLPQLQASYDVKLQGFSLNLAGVYQTYELQDLDDESLQAWGVAANARLTRLDPFYINAGGFYGQNVSNFGQYGNAYTTGAAIIDPENNDIEDTDTYGLALILGADLNMIGFQAGAGYRVSENDLWDEDLEMLVYYGQATIPVTASGNAFIVPEVGYFDYKDDLADQPRGDELYAGLKWQINF